MSLQFILKGYTLSREHQMKFLPWEGFQEVSVSAFDKTEIGTATTGVEMECPFREVVLHLPLRDTSWQICLLDFHLVANQNRRFAEEPMGGISYS
jgi:hypothetical protein